MGPIVVPKFPLLWSREQNDDNDDDDALPAKNSADAISPSILGVHIFRHTPIIDSSSPKSKIDIQHSTLLLPFSFFRLHTIRSRPSRFTIWSLPHHHVNPVNPPPLSDQPDIQYPQHCTSMCTLMEEKNGSRD